MLYAESPTDELNTLGRAVTFYSQQVLEAVRPQGETVEHDLVRNLYEDESRDAVFFVESGVLYAEARDRAIFYFEPGDLIGMHAFTGSPPAVVRSMEPVQLVRFNAANLRSQTAPMEAWQDYLTAQSVFYAQCCCAGVDDDTAPKAGFRRYTEGETIIQEGDAASEVYELMSGEAQVWVEGEQVGSIYSGELFGAMATLTQTTRTANVIANKPGMVMSVPIDHFNELLRSQPRTGLALLENMAHQMLKLNRELVDLKKNR